MCHSFVVTPSGLSLTSYQWCSPGIMNIVTFLHILLILSCFHWLPATAMELLWYMVFYHFFWEGLVHNWTREHYPIKLIIRWKRAGREKRVKGNKEIKKDLSHFMRLPEIGRLARETAQRASGGGILLLFHIYKVTEPEPSWRRVWNDLLMESSSREAKALRSWWKGGSRRGFVLRRVLLH